MIHTQDSRPLATGDWKAIAIKTGDHRQSEALLLVIDLRCRFSHLRIPSLFGPSPNHLGAPIGKYRLDE